jgi:hypothetical protein
MNWGHVVEAFFAGMFLANAVPHFVKGVCGDKFPTPFSKPPGKGLSSAPVNMVWALVNVLAGHVLWHFSKPCNGRAEMMAFVLGVVIIAVWSSVNFQQKDRQ